MPVPVLMPRANNRDVPAVNLPVEVLATIFELYMHLEDAFSSFSSVHARWRHQRTVLTGVCQFWRSIAQRDSLLYTYISVKTDRMGSSYFGDLLDRELERAGRRSVYLHIEFGIAQLYLPSILAARKAIARAQYIDADLKYSKDLDEVFASFSFFNPELRQFVISWPDTMQHAVPPTRPLVLDFSRCLELETFEFDADIGHPLEVNNSITLAGAGLALKSLNVAQGLKDMTVVDTLRLCPNLEELHWFVDGPQSADDEEDRVYAWDPEFELAVIEPSQTKDGFPPISLPALKRLRLVGEVPLTMLAHLIAPALEELWLDSSSIEIFFWADQNLPELLDDSEAFPLLKRLTVTDCRSEDIVRFQAFIAKHPGLTHLDVPWEIQEDDVHNYVERLPKLEWLNAFVHPTRFIRGIYRARRVLQAKRARVGAAKAPLAMFTLDLTGPWETDGAEQLANSLAKDFDVLDGSIPKVMLHLHLDDREKEEQHVLLHSDPLEVSFPIFLCWVFGRSLTIACRAWIDRPARRVMIIDCYLYPWIVYERIVLMWCRGVGVQ